MNFDEILSRLGERGESGDNTRLTLHSARANEGRIGANLEATGEKFAPFAQCSPSRESAPDKEIRPMRPVRPRKEEKTHADAESDLSMSTPIPPRKNSSDAFLAGQLGENYRLVSTWWQWTPEDCDTFHNWAGQHRKDAAAWIHQEAATVRFYVDTLGWRQVMDAVEPNRR